VPSKRRVIDVKVLPGQPTDGSGQVCIHLFVQDERGPFVEPHALHPVFEDGVQVKQKVEAKPTRGRLACNPKRTVTPVTRGNVTTITHRSDSPYAATCPKCKASREYIEMMHREEHREEAPTASPVEEK
jgi:hypothetical protein